MSAEAAFAIRKWSAGQYTCVLTLQRPKAGALVSCSIEWTPEQPTKLSDAEIAEYRRGRNQALAELSAEIGVSTAVVEC